MERIYIRSRFIVNALIMLLFMVLKKKITIDPAYLSVRGSTQSNKTKPISC